MLFWSRADDAALPQARQARGESSSEPLYVIDPATGRETESSHQQGSQLELIHGSAGGWVGTLRSVGRRFFDVSFAIFALLVTLPLLIVIVIAIRTSSPGPVFFRQRRLGLRGRHFECLKFRTMVQDADSVLSDLLAGDPQLQVEFDKSLKLKNDPRITRIGRFLRRTSLDELPQFWNVLKGEMSVVGPRPKLLEEAERYGQFMPLILSVKPGITGLWQVSGRNDTSYAERVELDRLYVMRRGFLLDLAIIARTIRVMITPSNGAY